MSAVCGLQSDCGFAALGVGKEWIVLMKSKSLWAVSLSAIFLVVAVVGFAASEPTTSPFGDCRDFAATPPMGWNSYDNFGAGVTEPDVLSNAAYVKEHLLAYGWQYVVIDFRWYDASAVNCSPELFEAGGTRRRTVPLTADEFGRLLPALNRFPSAVGDVGFKPIADKVHAMGLKFGIHIMRGIPRQSVAANLPIEGSPFKAADAVAQSRCGWCTDMYGVKNNAAGQAWYDSIFRQYAGWGVDFIKVDDLSIPYSAHEVEMVRKAIDKCGRPMVFSTSPGSTPLNRAKHVSSHANMWRVCADVWDNWKQLHEAFDLSKNWEIARDIGTWPDLDMLPLGYLGLNCVDGPRMSRLTHDEQRSLMTLWCIARSPLMFGGDLPKNDAWTKALITNAEVLAVNQNSENNHQLSRNGDEVIWIADVPNSKDKYLAIFNLSDNETVNISRKVAFDKTKVTRNTKGHTIDISADITGAKKLVLVVQDAGNGFISDHADWLNPTISGPKGELKLTELPWLSATAGFGDVHKGKSCTGKPLTVNGQVIADGIGTHAPSVIVYELPEGYTRFKAQGALDDGGAKSGKPGATVRFAVFLRMPLPLAEAGFSEDCQIRDLWEGKPLEKIDGDFQMLIPPHGAKLLRVSPMMTGK